MDNVFLFANKYDESLTNFKNTFIKLFIIPALLIGLLLLDDELSITDTHIILFIVLYVLQFIDEIINIPFNGFSYFIIVLSIVLCFAIDDIKIKGIFLGFILYNLLILNISYKNSDFNCVNNELTNKYKGYILPLFNQILLFITIGISIKNFNEFKDPKYYPLLIYSIILIASNYFLPISNLAYFKDAKCDKENYRKINQDNPLITTKKIFTLITIPLFAIIALLLYGIKNDNINYSIIFGLLIYLVLTIIIFFITKVVLDTEGGNTEIVEVKKENSEEKEHKEYLNNKENSINQGYNKGLYIFLFLLILSIFFILIENTSNKAIFSVIILLLTVLNTLNISKTFIALIVVIILVALSIYGILTKFKDILG